MFKSILVTSLRNIIRNKTFSFINLLGLSVGMSLGLLIIMIIREQYTYDNFHASADKIYRIDTRALRKEGGSENYASAPLIMGQTLHDNYTFVDKLVKIDWQINCDAVYENVNVPIHGFFADATFLQVFNFPLALGDPGSILIGPNSVVLTADASIKLFGKQEALGRTVTLKGYGDFIVNGVLKPFPGKTHFDFELLIPTTALPVLEKEHKVMATLDNWTNYYSGFVYVKLLDGFSVHEVEEVLGKISKEHYADVKTETRDKGYEFYLQPLSEITPGPILSNQMGKGLPSLLLIFMSALAGIVMLMACLNYTQLTVAKAINRVKEIGVRKTIGAQRWQVFMQFVGEAVVFSLVALVFSYLLLQFIKPAFLQLHITREFAVDLREDWGLLIFFMGFAVAIGMIAGLIPAAYLSAFKPAAVLKGMGEVKVFSGITFRKVLITAQFTLSIVFILFVMVVNKQINFMLKADYGINDKNLLNVRLIGTNFEKFSHEVQQISGVSRVAGVSHALGTWADRSDDYKKSATGEAFVMRDFIVDENYLSNIEATFVAGRNFNKDEDSEIERSIIINEMALANFGIQGAPSAIGQSVVVNDSTELRIVGVVRNFHFRPLNGAIGPVAFRCNSSQVTLLSVKFENQDPKVLAATIQSIWKKYDTVHPMEWKLMSDEIDGAYEDAGFYDVLSFTGYVAFLTVSLACLGMLGMAMYATQTRTKEIGVRKVMGASSRQIIFILSESFLKLMGIAVIIGVPISFLVADAFLSIYAYRIEMTVGLLLMGVALVTILGLITIASQTFRASVVNPVKSLRYE